MCTIPLAYKVHCLTPVQPHLRPVLGVTNMSTSGWKLDPDTHGCSLKGLLPYKQVGGPLYNYVCMLMFTLQSFRAPQGELLYHVLAQQNSKDAIHTVLGISRTHPQPNQLVEDSLVTLGVVAMETSEVS